MTMIITKELHRPFLRQLGLLAFVIGSVSPILGQPGSLTKAANVLILTGLPGDVESENAYQQQLERLLEILSLPEARPRRVVVLNDAGAVDNGTLTSSPELDLEIGVGNRSTFLDAASDLARADGSLTVIVWGHGGLQGKDPVFHVRGPRLGPADFRALAEQAQGPSQWILFFRQSGAFARQLRAPGREILSSENATAFKSDPAALPLLLEVLRQAPALSLSHLAARLGPMVTTWYEQQHLARQEEPTLWLGDAPGRSVIDESESRIEASTVATGAEHPESETPASLWRFITPVTPERYPQASAVVLRREVSYVLAESPAFLNEVDEFIQILTPEGTTHADFDLAYHPPGEKLTLLDVEVRDAKGAVTRVPSDQIRDATPEALPEYRPATRRTFSLPQAEPGTILRVHYLREWRRFPLPHIPLEVPLTGPLPVVESKIEIRVARDAPVHYTFRHHPRESPELGESPYGKTLSWAFRDLDAARPEVLSVPRSEPMLLISTFPSWDAFASWYRRLIRTADELTPEIAAMAKQLTSNAKTDFERVEALYNFVTGLRYIAIPFGVNSHRPHAAANVFANRYGDCKDKANLFNTMLASLGIEADLVLVPRFSQAHEETPGLGFNHAISRIRLGEREIWADTTDDVARFGLLPPGDPGRNVLVIHEDVSQLTRLPAPLPADHQLSFQAEIHLAAVGGPAASDLEINTAGFPDYALRSLARAMPHSGTRPLPLTHFEPLNGYFSMSRQRATPASALDRDFTWHGQGQWTGLTSLVGQDVLLRAPFLLPTNWRLALHERTTALYLNSGYPLTLNQEIVFNLPDDLETELRPQSLEEKQGPLRWRVSWRREGSRLEAQLEVVLPRGELNWDETVVFQRSLRQLYEALGQGVLLTTR